MSEGGRPYDEILSLWSVAVQFVAVATEAMLFVHRLSSLWNAASYLPHGPLPHHSMRLTAAMVMACCFVSSCIIGMIVSSRTPV
jgi:hypothetical protein